MQRMSIQYKQQWLMNIPKLIEWKYCEGDGAMSEIVVPEYVTKMLNDAGVKEKIGQFGLENNVPITFSVSIPVKGNSKKINHLLLLGWHKGLTRKCRTDNNLNRNQYEGYVMQTTLTWHIKED